VAPRPAHIPPKTVWIYVDTSKQVGDKDHVKVFASQDAAETWFEENDPEGVAFEYGFWSEPHRPALVYADWKADNGDHLPKRECRQ
jgi:hypothetical protein